MAATVVLTVWVCIKAGKASAANRKENEAIMKRLKEENVLRNEFAVLTPSLAEKSEPSKLFRGVSLNLQKRISDAADMEGEFARLSPEQREIYALSIVAEDGADGLGNFFKANGEPLVSAAANGVKRLFPGRASEIFEAELRAFSPDDETESVVPERIKALDGEFASVAGEKDIAVRAGRFIASEADKFI